MPLVSVHIFRVTVRGRFDGLDDETRARLLADQPHHDVVSSGAFTEAGTLTYEEAVDFFTFRVQLRGKGDDAEADVRAEAEARAVHAMTELGAGHREGLKVTTTDMASVWQ
jgi:hypothetical protein